MGVLSSSDCQSVPCLQLLCYLIIPSEGLEVMVIILLYFSGPSLISFRFSNFKHKLACENIRFSSLFAAGVRRNGKGLPSILPAVLRPKRWSHK